MLRAKVKVHAEQHTIPRVELAPLGSPAQFKRVRARCVGVGHSNYHQRIKMSLNIVIVQRLAKKGCAFEDTNTDVSCCPSCS